MDIYIVDKIIWLVCTVLVLAQALFASYILFRRYSPTAAAVVATLLSMLLSH